MFSLDLYILLSMVMPTILKVRCHHVTLHGWR